MQYTNHEGVLITTDFIILWQYETNVIQTFYNNYLARSH
jgi:hypothetical protein